MNWMRVFNHGRVVGKTLPTDSGVSSAERGNQRAVCVRVLMRPRALMLLLCSQMTNRGTEVDVVALSHFSMGHRVTLIGPGLWGL